MNRPGMSPSHPGKETDDPLSTGSGDGGVRNTLSLPAVFLFCLYEKCPFSARASAVGCLPQSRLGIVPSLTVGPLRGISGTDDRLL